MTSPLTIAEEQFRLLVESVCDYAIFMLDATGHVASWNAGARLIKGYAAEEIIGQHLSVFYEAADRADGKPQRLLDTAAREGRLRAEGWRVRKDGSRFWADVVITAVRDASGHLLGYGKVTRDMSDRRVMEEELRHTQERLATTLHSIGDGVIATDMEQRVTTINPVAQRLTGWAEHDALGRPLAEVFHIINEYTRAGVSSPVLRVLAEGTIVGLANHTILIARDGSELPIADSAAPIRAGDGSVRGAVLVFRDVSEERRAEEALRQSETRLRLMIASVRDYAIFMLDPSGRVVSWNAGAERIKGYREEEIIGAHLSRFFTPEDIAAGKPARELEIAASEGRFEDESYRVRKDGSRFWANVVLSAVRNASGRLLGFAKVTRDLTERRQMEDQRVRLAQASEAVRLRDEFLSIASHELKTPLTALQLQLQGLLDRRGGLEDKLARKVERAARSGERLSDLVDSLLDVSRITTGAIALRYEDFDLVEATRDVVERLRDNAFQARCDVVFEAAAPVWGRWDRLRIEQIVTNLLSNAFKYAAGAPVRVSVEQEGEQVTLAVRDGGPGLRDSDVTRVFDRFERASSPSYGGLGLGLFVSRKVVEAHGGTIHAESKEGAGARFIARLPLRPALLSTPPTN